MNQKELESFFRRKPKLQSLVKPFYSALKKVCKDYPKEEEKIANEKGRVCLLLNLNGKSVIMEKVGVYRSENTGCSHVKFRCCSLVEDIAFKLGPIGVFFDSYYDNSLGVITFPYNSDRDSVYINGYELPDFYTRFWWTHEPPELYIPDYGLLLKKNRTETNDGLISAMERVANSYNGGNFELSKSTLAVCLIETGFKDRDFDDTDTISEIRKFLQNTENLPIFWQFICACDHKTTAEIKEIVLSGGWQVSGINRGFIDLNDLQEDSSNGFFSSFLGSDLNTNFYRQLLEGYVSWHERFW